MILPAQKIRELCTSGTIISTYIEGRLVINDSAPHKPSLMIEPFHERTEFMGKTFGLGPCTYDMRCGQDLVILPRHLWWKFKAYQWLDTIRHELGYDKLYENYRIGFTLASSIERVAMPDNVCATVMDKSSWARKGMSVFNTHFDPGFAGYPTLELSNNGNDILHITKGMAICQFKFEMLYETTEIPYRGKYMNQPDRPVEAKEGLGAWA